MSYKQAEELLKKYSSGACTPQEKNLVEQWYFQEAGQQAVPDGPSDPLLEEELIWNRIAAATAQSVVRKVQPYKWAAVAASVLIALSVGFYLYTLPGKTPFPSAAQQAANILPEPGNRAVLTLANGKTIALDQVSAGALASQGNVKITKTAEGDIIYQAPNSALQNAPVSYNTITTPKGGQYHIVLPDGTAVWLNASSALHYPAQFPEGKREVELSGEGYFEVAKIGNQQGQRIPFLVKTGGQVIEVLGTHFNINGYLDDGRIKTTLLEGSIRVAQINNHQSRVIRPGEQAQVGAGPLRVLTNVDVEQAVAWKSGFFEFDDTDITLVLKQISRFYNVEIVYQGKPPELKLGGRINRNLPLSLVLKSLEPDLKFRISGNKLTVIN